jgi:heptosyltransferase I
MKKILLIKITSMGDLIQMLPALTDAANALPGIQFDWLAEESFKEIPRLHPTVDKIITLPYRLWKKGLRQGGIQWNEIKQFLTQLRNQQYDMVIDAQSNIKSALVTLLAKGMKYGLDGKSVREYGANFAYHKKININRRQNHAERMRQLMATFLQYTKPQTPADYGINQQQLPTLDFHLPEKFIFMTAISSSRERLWPEPFWQAVISDVLLSGYEVILPWWSKEEQERVLRLKQNDPRVHLIPPLNLTQKASVLAKAVAAISLDTGLAHMAAALNIPNVSLYGPTSAKLTGTVGKKQIHLSASGPSCAPCVRTKCNYQGDSQYKPACLETITPKQVLDSFYNLLS